MRRAILIAAGINWFLMGLASLLVLVPGWPSSGGMLVPLGLALAPTLLTAAADLVLSHRDRETQRFALAATLIQSVPVAVVVAIVAWLFAERREWVAGSTDSIVWLGTICLAVLAQYTITICLVMVAFVELAAMGRESARRDDDAPPATSDSDRPA